MLKAGIIGLGVGEQHIAGYNAHPRSRTVAICDVDPAKLAEVGARHPQLARTTDPEAILRDPAIDVVSIASYDDAHHAQVIMALEAGKHVFVEKPLCQTRAEMDDIHAALAARPNLRLSSNLILRRSPRFVDLRARIGAGALGRVYQIEADYNYGRIEKITQGWRGRMPFYSVMLGGGVHVVDLMVWLTGASVVDVCAVGSRIATAGTDFRFPDAVTALLRFDNGAIGKVSANFGCVYPHFHKLSVYGTTATFEQDPSGARLYESRDPNTPPFSIDIPYPGVQKGAGLAEFIDAIFGQGVPMATEDDVFSTMAICLAIEDAMRGGLSIRVDYPHLLSASRPA